MHSFFVVVVKSTMLMYQSPTTGLFPTKTCGGEEKSKVHESLYCAAGAWALALAYRWAAVCSPANSTWTSFIELVL